MASDESFKTPVSSTEDLMTLSPKRNGLVDLDTKSDFLTDTEFDSICDVTMREVPLRDDNLFIDANSLDYLVKCTESKKNQTLVDRGKDSLFVKFDPLYAKTTLANCTQENSREELSESDIGYETASNNSMLADVVPHSITSSAASVTSKCGIDKPTQIVSPVVSAEVPKAIPTFAASVAPLVRSVSAILTPTPVGPERLVNISGGTPPMAAPRSPRFKYNAAQDFNHVQSLRVILQNQDQELSYLRHENKELKYTLQNTKEELGNKIKKLEGDVQNLVQREQKLVQQINDKALSNKQMAIVMEEYEKTITVLINEQEKVTSEKEDALKHLTNMESSFNDLLAKYEKCKIVINDFKDSQKAMQQKILENEAGMKKYENLYNTLKKITSDSLNKANETLDQVNKAHNIEVTKLNANIKKHEITISSLQESLTQKNREIEELTTICDQLINTK
ncbi:transforming acidic coiled-coil-containing protein 3-like [Maniola jurtina]|uniref:transforming acidic coiled-coil-containing protein 3-like n=1 Tax=Maniola jurtina TaxID=191418 RepID=UPI001E68781E|nr:transforming acidic coiled-coil-containing protein 3-like [Maniola jurtina]